MKKRKLVVLVSVALLNTGAALTTLVADRVEATPLQAEDNAAKASKFNGKVEAVDQKENTLTVAGKVIHVAAGKTKIVRDGKSIQLSDLKVGEQVHGMTRTTTDGKTEALTVKTGEAPQAPGKE